MKQQTDGEVGIFFERDRLSGQRAGPATRRGPWTGPPSTRVTRSPLPVFSPTLPRIPFPPLFPEPSPLASLIARLTAARVQPPTYQPRSTYQPSAKL